MGSHPFSGISWYPMTMQFTWQGCDSILAAPLVIDLVRLVDAPEWLVRPVPALAGKFF